MCMKNKNIEAQAKFPGSYIKRKECILFITFDCIPKNFEEILAFGTNISASRSLVRKLPLFEYIEQRKRISRKNTLRLKQLPAGNG